MPEMSERPVYLGDAVYAEYDGYHVRLFTSDGQQELNVIFIEYSVWRNLEAFVGQIWKPLGSVTE